MELWVIPARINKIFISVGFTVTLFSKLRIHCQVFFINLRGKMDPGERIREFRKSRGLTQIAFSKKIGYSPGYLAEIELGVKDPSREFLKKLNEVFGISSDYILYDTPSLHIMREKQIPYHIKEKPLRREFIVRIEVTEKEKKIIENVEGTSFVEEMAPILIAKSASSADAPREVEKDPDGVAIIYKDWAKNHKDFTAIRVKGNSMKPTIESGSLVGIDHSKKNPGELNGKMVAIRKNDEAIITRLRMISKDLALGIPDNPDSIEETVVLRGDEIRNAIIGKVSWWLGRQR
jgi:transcriptional regulator with XRE-family HTH domain